MEQNADGWPEITYQYVMHYFWEPNHLFLKKDEDKLIKATDEAKKHSEKPRRRDLVRERMLAEEVPLNYLLNVLLRLAPAAIRRACLEPFGVDLLDGGLASLVVKTPGEFKGDGLKTQPDVHLESETARVFIEVKVKAILTLQQIEKYVCLHAKLDEPRREAKRRYVLFLVNPNTNSDMLEIEGIQQSILHKITHERIVKQLGHDASEVTFGATTWAKLAETLEKELDRQRGEQTEATEMLEVLIGDFLTDLKKRSLIS